MFDSFDVYYGDLLPNGQDTAVLYADRAKYVSMLVSQKLSDGRHLQAQAIREGLNWVIPQTKMWILQPVDLQVLPRMSNYNLAYNIRGSFAESRI